VATFAGIMAEGCAPEAEGSLEGAEAAAANASEVPASPLASPASTRAARLESGELGSQADLGSTESENANVSPAQAADGTTAPVRAVAAETRAPLVLPAGTRVRTKLNDYLDSGESSAGDLFTMTVIENVYVGGDVAIRVGSQIRGYVASAESARRPNKGGRLILKADSMVIDGKRVLFEAIVTAETEREGQSSIKEDWKEIAAGAGVGGLVGGLIGGGKGVLAGVLVGGGGTFLATKGEQIELPPDTELIVELREPVQVPS
jgi:hypothetical protein